MSAMTGPTCLTQPRMRTPNWASSFLAIAPAATRQIVSRALGRPPLLVPVPFADLPDGASPYGPNPRRSAGYDLSRIRELGFEPSALADALPETLAWYLARRPSHPGYAGRARELELARLRGG